MAERPTVLEATEPIRELWPIFHRLELALRIGIVVGGVRPTVGFGHTQIGEQERYRFGTHRHATISMETDLAWLDLLLLPRVGDGPSGQVRTLA